MKPLKKIISVLTAFALTLILPINVWAADSSVTGTEDAEIIEAPAETDVPTVIPDTGYDRGVEGDDELLFNVPDYVYGKPEIDIVIPSMPSIPSTPKIITEEIPDSVRYVPYSYFIEPESTYNKSFMKFAVTKGKLPEGLTFNADTGELYGMMITPGDYTFTIGLKYNGSFCDYREYNFTVKNNSDENVDAVNSGAQGYALNERISENITVYYAADNENNSIVKIDVDNALFWSEGSFGEFVDFYMDGKKLEKDVDYTAEEGSTKITVRDQTFGNTGVTKSNVPHTLAAEFRTESGEMKVSAQNVYITYSEEKTDNKSTEETENNAGTGSVTATMNIVDVSGKPVSGLRLVLHSEPKEAVTDSRGNVKFDHVEFGKHKLYVLNSDGNNITSMLFSIISGTEMELKDNVISAKDGASINIFLEYDGSKLKMRSLQEDVSAGAGVYGENAAIGAVDTSNKYGAGFAVGAACICIVVIMTVKSKRKLERVHIKSLTNKRNNDKIRI